MQSGNVRIKVIGGRKKAEDLYLAIKDTIEGVTVQGSDKTALHVNIDWKRIAQRKTS